MKLFPRTEAGMLACLIAVPVVGLFVWIFNAYRLGRFNHSTYKKIASAALFLIGFIATYLIICFVIPGMRIKLEAEPLEYFIKSIRHMAFIKTAASIVVALILGAIPLLLGKKN